MVRLSIFLPFAFGYFLSYLFRAVNAVAGPAIMADIELSAVAFGFLSSAYFLAFAAAQIPLGIALDRYPAARVNAFLLLFAAGGALLFSLGTNGAMLTAGRALIGLGVSACLMAALKTYAALLPAERLPLINGLHLTVGGLGLFAGGLPAETMIALMGWRGLFALLALLSCLAAFALSTFPPAQTTRRNTETLWTALREAGAIWISRPFLALAPAATAAQTTALAWQSLWAGPWLRDVGGFSPGAAAGILSAMALATTIGYAAIGWLGSRLARAGIGMEKITIFSITLFIFAQILLLVLPPRLAVVAWLVFAFLGAGGTLAYAALTARFPAHLAGRVNTALNFALFVATFAVQGLVGVIIDALEPGFGVRFAHGAALSLMLLFQGSAVFWYFLSKRRASLGRLEKRAP